jgi:hypothetical protein
MKVLMQTPRGNMHGPGLTGGRGHRRPQQSEPQSLAVIDPEDFPASPVQDALATFEDTVGGRAQLIAVIESNPKLQPFEQRLVNKLATSTLKSLPLVELCVEADCTIGQLFDAYKRGHLARAHVQAISEIADQVPAIVKDILDKCQTTTQPCASCEGSGEIDAKDCGTCKGSGSVVVASSLDHQKVVLGLLGFLQKGANVNVNTNVQTNVIATASGGRPGGTLDRLHDALSGILRQPIDLPEEDPVVPVPTCE